MCPCGHSGDAQSVFLGPAKADSEYFLDVPPGGYVARRLSLHALRRFVSGGPVILVSHGHAVEERINIPEVRGSACGA